MVYTILQSLSTPLFVTELSNIFVKNTINPLFISLVILLVHIQQLTSSTLIPRSLLIIPILIFSLRFITIQKPENRIYLAFKIYILKIVLYLLHDVIYNPTKIIQPTIVFVVDVIYQLVTVY